ncbi:MAG: indolepyruvate ferredoxin oxidoreductase, beta subunit [Candidatus Methanomethylophilaceae archaeon]|nr:indolepyruvate ferredoxin oxidoreductase, beta subunit [Candidatus Methanomethylophilaceae archaeon]MDI3542239.1 indolepyruvate ferredoxin oxidoreductase, beta subunit [Candidatus Methanomethylophilaceae archaeon]HIJ00520.1 indolepyruvate oxidoreductase subunit beta [Candidatus Methanomethylophilaceae archaeon]
MKYSIQIAGVGGQGVLLASSILGNAALKEGYELAMSEVHGMAQRGGSVLSTVRFGDDVISPLEAEGQADLLLGFEPVETYRVLNLVNKESYIVMNLQVTVPPKVSMGMEEYPDIGLLVDNIRSVTDRLITMNATELAIEAGKAVAANAVLIGAVAGIANFPLRTELLEETLLETVPSRFGEVNARAFRLGLEAVRSAR